jgi:hypothetical protein
MLDSLTRNSILFDDPPLVNELLIDSLFYTSSGIDTGVIKDCISLRQDLNIKNFLLCDYGITKQTLDREGLRIGGYFTLGSRTIDISTLIPNSWNPEIPPRVDPEEYFKYYDKTIIPFAVWTVFQKARYNINTESPNRFSVIFICGEGAATYQALYWSNNIKPKALAIIQPGSAFGGNWANFTDEDGAFGWVVKNNPAGLPEYIYNGGYGEGHQTEFWSGYKLIDTIQNYYSNRILQMQGKVNLFKLER